MKITLTKEQIQSLNYHKEKLEENINISTNLSNSKQEDMERIAKQVISEKLKTIPDITPELESEIFQETIQQAIGLMTAKLKTDPTIKKLTDLSRKALKNFPVVKNNSIEITNEWISANLDYLKENNKQMSSLKTQTNTPQSIESELSKLEPIKNLLEGLINQPRR